MLPDFLQGWGCFDIFLSVLCNEHQNLASTTLEENIFDQVYNGKLVFFTTF